MANDRAKSCARIVCRAPAGDVCPHGRHTFTSHALLPLISLQDPRGQLAEEHSVVCDEDQGRFPPRQRILQPLDRGQVQMVGRLVEEQQLGIRDNRPRQQHAPIHSGRRGFKAGVGRQLHVGQNSLDPPLGFPGRFVVLGDGGP